jgi:thiamine biosynthesis protein ThiS
MPAAPARSRIRVRINGEDRELDDGATLGELLVSLGLAERRIAVAVNRDVIRRAERAATRLAAGDRVEILEAVGGG